MTAPTIDAMDAHIRRALGWDVEPGELADFEMHAPGVWSFGQHTFHHNAYVNNATTTKVPALEGVTDEHEARRVIAEAL